MIVSVALEIHNQDKNLSIERDSENWCRGSGRRINLDLSDIVVFYDEGVRRIRDGKCPVCGRTDLEAIIMEKMPEKD